MADVNITPRISCDNCGTTVDKEPEKFAKSKSYIKPKDWGSCKMEGSTSDTYGAKDRLDFTDLCPKCAKAAVDAVAAAMKAIRGDDDADPR